MLIGILRVDHRIADGSVFECLVCPAPDVMFAPLGVIPNGLPRTEVEVEVGICWVFFGHELVAGACGCRYKALVGMVKSICIKKRSRLSAKPR